MKGTKNSYNNIEGLKILMICAKGYLLYLHSGNIKIDAYLLQFLCHMTSGVKFPHVFLFSYLHCCSKALFYEVKELY